MFKKKIKDPVLLQNAIRGDLLKMKKKWGLYGFISFLYFNEDQGCTANVQMNIDSSRFNQTKQCCYQILDFIEKAEKEQAELQARMKKDSANGEDKEEKGDKDETATH